MMYDIENVSPSELQKEDIKRCKKLTLSDGAMRSNLRSLIEYNTVARIFLVRNKVKEIIAWAIYYRTSKENFFLQLFVDSDYRRQHIGKSLIQEIKKYHVSKKRNKLIIIFFNCKNKMFFDKIEEVEKREFCLCKKCSIKVA